MATNALTCSASTLVSNNMASRSLLPVRLGRHPVLPPTPSSKAPSSRTPLVVKAHEGGSPSRIHPEAGDEHTRKRVALVETAPYGHVKTLWSTIADENEIRVWVDTTGKGEENIKVNVVNGLLVIKENGGQDAYGSKILSTRETTLHLPFNANNEEIKPESKLGLLCYIISKEEEKVSDNQVKSD